MPVQRTDLQDELTALIAAGRELSPDHDRELAEVFIDRMMSRQAPPSRTRHVPTIWAKPGRLLGAAILALACLGVGSLLAVDHTGSANMVQQAPISVKVQGIPAPRKVPIAPPR